MPRLQYTEDCDHSTIALFDSFRTNAEVPHEERLQQYLCDAKDLCRETGFDNQNHLVETRRDCRLCTGSQGTRLSWLGSGGIIIGSSICSGQLRESMGSVMS